MDQQLCELFSLADSLSREVLGTTSPNPPVGALILAPDGEVIGRGATQPAGGAHAEVMALKDAASRRGDLTGCRAVVTLEPCDHTGRTGPCTQALLAAGITAVDYLFADPHGPAAGGAQTLTDAGVTVHGPYAAQPGHEQPWDKPWVLEPWLRAIVRQRPHVCLKWAATVDGFVAARDGSSQWITGPEARAAVHVDRCQRDAIVVGSGTVQADNPRLTARDPESRDYPAHLQPLRVVMGQSEVDTSARIIGEDGRFVHIATRSVEDALDELWARGVVNILVEGGPRLSSAFLASGMVDEVQVYHAPALLGGGKNPMGSGQGGGTMADISRFTPREITRWGTDIRWSLTKATSTTDAGVVDNSAHGI